MDSKKQFVRDQLQPLRNLDKAAIRDSRANPAGLIVRINLPLTTAQTESDPYKINFPFKTVYVADASDASTEISMKLASRLGGTGAVPLQLKDVIEQELPIDGAFLHWDAQPGKTMTLILFLESSFRSGSQVSSTAGGVVITEGSSFEPQASVTLVAATAGIIIPQNLDRKCGTIQNNTGADLYIGASTVTNSGATLGLRVAAGAYIKWRNTGALYGYSVAGGVVTYIEEE